MKALAAVFAAGELDAERWDAVRAHLRSCRSCREALAAHDELAARLAPMADPAVPAGLSRRVIEAARQEGIWAARRQPADLAEPATATDWNPIGWWRAATASLRWASVGLAVVGAILGGVAGDWLARDAGLSGTDGLTSGSGFSGTDGLTSGSGLSGADGLDGHAFEYLLDAPNGSLAECYLAVQQGEWEGP